MVITQTVYYAWLYWQLCNNDVDYIKAAHSLWIGYQALRNEKNRTALFLSNAAKEALTPEIVFIVYKDINQGFLIFWEN